MIENKIRTSIDMAQAIRETQQNDSLILSPCIQNDGVTCPYLATEKIKGCQYDSGIVPASLLNTETALCPRNGKEVILMSLNGNKEHDIPSEQNSADTSHHVQDSEIK